MNYASIIMIIYAVWATIEVITNAFGARWPPETGIPADELFNNPDRDQKMINGLIIGLGAVCGTLGFLIQYLPSSAYADASMTATAAPIIQQATDDLCGVDAEEAIVIVVAATIAADAAIRESSEDTLEQAKEIMKQHTAAVEEMMAAVQER